jgi:ribulose-5-phosphate 4-epimerase/fuculose-1-phosphate aldolase
MSTDARRIVELGASLFARRLTFGRTGNIYRARPDAGAYHAPGDAALEPLAEATARDHHAFLLASHGPVVAGADLAAAADAVEELEETARLHLLLQGHHTRPLTPEQAAGVRTPSGAAR